MRNTNRFVLQYLRRSSFFLNINTSENKVCKKLLNELKKLRFLYRI